MAMRKEIANLSTRFSVTGLNTVRGRIREFASTVQRSLASPVVRAPFRAMATSAGVAVIAIKRLGTAVKRVGFRAMATSLRAITSAMRVAAVTARGLATAITGIGGLAALTGSLSGIVAVNRALRDTYSRIAQLSKISATLDMGISELSVFSSYAAGLGLELEDIRQAMTQFYGVAGEAAEGNNEYSRTFARMGLDMSKAENQGLSMIQLFRKFSVELQRFRGSERTAILTGIFGDDDATKVAQIADAFSGSMNGYAEARRKAALFGAIVTPRDERLFERMRGITNDLKTSFEGLQLSIFRAFAPSVMGLIRIATALIMTYRDEIAHGLRGAFERVLQFGHDFLHVFFGTGTLVPVKNSWLFKVKEGAEIAIDVLGSLWNAAIQVGRALNNELEMRTGKTILDWIKEIDEQSIRAAFQSIVAVVGDVFDVLAGRDHDITTGIGRTLREWRDAIAGMISSTVAWVQGAVANVMGAFNSVVSFLTPIFSVVSKAWTDFVAGFQFKQINEMAGPFYVLGAAVAVAMNFLTGFITNLHAMIALGQDAQGGFVWMNWVRDTLEFIIAAGKGAYDMFKGIYDIVAAIFAFFGQDLTQWLFFIGLMKFTGLGKLLIGTFTGLIKIVGKALVAFRNFAAFITSGGALAAALRTVGEAAKNGAGAGFDSLKGKIDGVIAKMKDFGSKAPGFMKWLKPIGKLGLVGGMIAGGALIGGWLGGWLGNFFGDWFFKTQEKLDGLKEQMEATLDATGGIKPGRSPAQRPASFYAAAMPSAARDYGSSYITGRSNAAGNGKMATVRFTDGDNDYDLYTDDDTFDRLDRNLRFNPIGAA